MSTRKQQPTALVHLLFTKAKQDAANPTLHRPDIVLPLLGKGSASTRGRLVLASSVRATLVAQ
jgi:hypothetical protein